MIFICSLTFLFLIKIRFPKEVSISETIWNCVRIKEKSPEVRLATFLHVGGEDAIEKYNGFTFDSEEDQRNVEVVIEKFDRDCQSNINVLAARYEFYNRRQQKDETYDQYVTQLRGLSIYCDFTNIDEALRDQFVFNIRCEKAKTKLINDSYSSHRNLSFDKAFAIAKATEITLFQAKEGVENKDEPIEVNKVNTDMKKPYTIKNCKFCGKNHEIKNVLLRKDLRKMQEIKSFCSSVQKWKEGELYWRREFKIWKQWWRFRRSNRNSLKFETEFWQVRLEKDYYRY